MTTSMLTLDGNEAAARIAYLFSEVCAIYPITPSSTMAELADEWANQGLVNLWGQVPEIFEMQSEGGAAGTVHGALQGGALATTFTASQGLMLMIPNMYKIAGELSPTVFHVAARSLAAQGLSIFGDHQDVMAVRATGFALLASASVQEAQDMAVVAHIASLRSRVPFLHFFDGFRTSHEVNKINALFAEDIRELVDDNWVWQHRERALSPERPKIRGTAQNPDVYFQARESVNLYYQATPDIVSQSMLALAKISGRHYQPFDYNGATDAERVIVVMGSASITVKKLVDYRCQQGEKIGVITVRLYRPFSAKHLLAVLPASVQHIAVLDRTKEPGAYAEPLQLDVESVIHGNPTRRHINIIGGRYGLSSKEFTPAMVDAIFNELSKNDTKTRFTVGINDDLSNLSLSYDASFVLPEDGVKSALFYGLGSDGTVGANKNTIKIVNQQADYHAQGYFVYDSKKSGSTTISHLRFAQQAIDAPYLVEQAELLAVHQPQFLQQIALANKLKPKGILLINTPLNDQQLWQSLTYDTQRSIVDKALKVYAIDASAVAKAGGMGQRINTIMQACFFGLAHIMPLEKAFSAMKQAISKSYHNKGDNVVAANHAVVDASIAAMRQVTIGEADSELGLAAAVSADAPAFIKSVTAKMIRGLGDQIPVSQLPDDGTWPSGSSQYEKRNIAASLPQWDSETCIQCGNCVMVCPHAALRSRFYHQAYLEQAPSSFESAPLSARGYPDTRYTLQLYADDCTGCGLCFEACPVRNQQQRALNMLDKPSQQQPLRDNLAFFESLPVNDRSKVDFSTVHGVQFLEPLFEFSGACRGCGETPYLKLATQLFGDRMLVANATGCSSIYGGNLPTTPWSKNAEGQGPAWANSLFEDNAEFGLGLRLSADQQQGQAKQLLSQWQTKIGEEQVEQVLQAPQQFESQLRAQRQRLNKIKRQLQAQEHAQPLLSVLDYLLRRSVWIVGGDGWAYDIGFGGLDHVLASGRDVNILVMDTEVYSNTGGQMSKSTPLGAVAKFAAGGKTMAKKDVAMQAIAYGNVYVARIALGADPQQSLLAFREAEAYPGPSLIIAYSHCIAHGIDMQKGLEQQQNAVLSGHWPLIRYNPILRKAGQNPFTLDSLRPSLPLRHYREQENRYQILAKSNPQEAERLIKIAEQVAQQKWASYEEMANRDASHYHPDARRDS
ncbi:pyruvate:ferredoxin (flavodoxin) oxidoreductase [Agarivorans sp. TSD2052]|uniref:pyruvate:ferredoxin (flavodoxin) oxidoreductase n=1 Tax=Agarivorans sp. TSD2052 TaxID=2937286 RepID=UPI00200D0322|nr:pyruvate:ferredoxin (flavodoxin) oxidoreductase [Agarivorans sp. TSD2052]UPW17280.1 pyruvate:ferredoxin (flavodoxin) oxidoreductase [Agarivorans sp. TSD2052]